MRGTVWPLEDAKEWKGGDEDDGEGGDVDA